MLPDKLSVVVNKCISLMQHFLPLLYNYGCVGQNSRMVIWLARKKKTRHISFSTTPLANYGGKHVSDANYVYQIGDLCMSVLLSAKCLVQFDTLFMCIKINTSH
ncbi:hypothetical protein QQG55_55200 [Brugia pahangi]